MIGSRKLPVVHRLRKSQPILRREENHPWENKVVFNPAAVLVEDRETLDRIIAALPFDNAVRKQLAAQQSLTFLLYRAQGMPTTSYDHSRSSLGLAVLTPKLELLARHSEPILLPNSSYDDLGVEDPRVTRIGQKFYMCYCGYNSGADKKRMRIALASSVDLVHWEKHGLLRGAFNLIDNKNGMLFPQKVGGKYLLFHRPMEGKDAFSIHLAEADDLLGEWTSRGVVMKPLPNPEFKETRVGGGAPPIPLPDGRFLVIYHIGNRRMNGEAEYRLGIAVADPSKPEFFVKRDEPLLRPQTPAETKGDADLGVNNVVFICAAYFYEGDLYIPYAGADSVVLAGRIEGAELEEYFGGM
jgi:beta-1,2-mannobiose phosphorylase / 1,2-beta-oligomannan phosphorylase